MKIKIKESAKKSLMRCREHPIRVLESFLVAVAAIIICLETVSASNPVAFIRSPNAANLAQVLALAVYRLVFILASVFFCICLWQNIKPQEKPETQAPQKNRKNRISWPSAICGTVILCNLAVPGILSYTPNALAALLWMAVFVLRLAAWLESKWLYHRWAAFFFAASLFFPYAVLLSLFCFDKNTLLNLGLSGIIEEISESAQKRIEDFTKWGSIAVYAFYGILKIIFGYLLPKCQKNDTEVNEKKLSLVHRRRKTLYKECFQRKHKWSLPILWGLPIFYMIGVGIILLFILLYKENERTAEWLEVLAIVGGLPLIVGDFILSRLNEAPLLDAERQFLQSNEEKCQDHETVCKTKEKNGICEAVIEENDFIQKYCDIITHVICAIGTSSGHDRVKNYHEILLPLKNCPDCETRYILETLNNQKDLFSRYRSEFRDSDVQEINRDVSAAICLLFKVPDASSNKHNWGISLQSTGQLIAHLWTAYICFDPTLKSWISQTTLQDTNEHRYYLLLEYIHHIIEEYRDKAGREKGQCLLVKLCAKNCTAVCIRKELFRQLLYYPRFAWNKLTERYPSQFNVKRSDSVVQNDWVETYFSYFFELKRLGVTIDPDFWDGIDGEYFSSVICEKTPLDSDEALKSIINRLDPKEGTVYARVWKYIKSMFSKSEQEIVIAKRLLDILKQIEI